MIEDYGWYKKIEKRPWLLMAGFIGGVLAIAGVVALIGLIF